MNILSGVQKDPGSVCSEMGCAGIAVKDGRLDYKWMYGKPGAYWLKDLLEELGWECDFEGDRWELNTDGVYYIKQI